jgi:hypothetical protein
MNSLGLRHRSYLEIVKSQAGSFIFQFFSSCKMQSRCVRTEAAIGKTWRHKTYIMCSPFYSLNALNESTYIPLLLQPHRYPQVQINS